MLVCIPFAEVWYFTNQLKDFYQSLVAVSAFASNILFWRETGYFDTAAEFKPLLHTWSLAVEEQYYVIFPLFLMLFWKLNKRWILVLLGFVFVTSLALAQWASYAKPATAFYLLPTRGWELLIGAFAAFYLSHVKQKEFCKATSEVGGWLGVALIIYAVFAFSKATPFPGFYALVPTLGTLLVILFATKQNTVGKIVGNRPFAGVGLISYSAYLWHQPLLAFAKQRYYGDLNPPIAITIVCVTFMLAFFSWLYIETPIRRRQFLSSRIALFSASLSALVAFFGVGLYGDSVNFLDKRSTPSFLIKFETQSDYIADNFYLIAESWELQKRINGVPFFGVDNIDKDKELLFDLADSRRRLLVVGNSHSVDFYNVLYHSKKISSIYQLARFGVQISNIDDSLFSSPNYQSADVVVYCSLMSDSDIDNIERVILRATNDKKKVFVCENMFMWMDRANFTKLDKLILGGLEKGKSLKELSSEINDTYTNDFLSGNYANKERRDYAVRFSDRIKELSLKYQFSIINRMDYVCPQQKCKLVSDALGKYFFDMGHHTMLGAKYFSTIVDSDKIRFELTEIDEQ